MISVYLLINENDIIKSLNFKNYQQLEYCDRLAFS